MKILLLVFWIGIATLSFAQSPAQDPPAFSPADEVNRALPPWVRLGGEYRVRFEGYEGGGFKPDSSDAYMLNRIRLNLTIQPVEWLKFFVQGQDARAIGKSPAAPPYEDTWDIRQGFVEFGDIEKTTFGLRVGRQEINFGDQRLIGSSNWTNTARTFDAIRSTIRHEGLRLDLFAASVVTQVNGAWDHHQDGNNIHGLYGGIEKIVPDATIEPYLFWRLQPRITNEAGAIANVDMKVPGIRWIGKLPSGFDYRLEMVKEFGSAGSDSIRAWAGHWVVGRTFKAVRFTPRGFAEYNYATGDRNAKDGVRGTFDQLYPTAHDKYGLADQVGWKNIKDVRAGLEMKPGKNWTATVEYNNWHLASPYDALYNTSSTAIARSPNGTAGTHVGQEFDITALWTVRKYFAIGAGFGHIFPGEFLKKTTPGTAYNFPYVMFTCAF